jgi:thiamine-phosphate pyrophosphorylase
VRLPGPLLLVTDRRQARRPLEDIVATALEAGCRWISLRERDLPAADRTALVERLLPLVRRYDARLSLHSDPHAEKHREFDGVHLPSNGDAAAARALVGPDKLVGISVHGAADVAAIDPRIVDYAIAGPFALTQSKPGYGPALGHAGLAAIVRALPVPVVAIGGVDAANVADAVGAGAAGIAVMGGVMRADDPAREVRALLAALDRAGSYRARYVATP